MTDIYVTLKTRNRNGGHWTHYQGILEIVSHVRACALGPEEVECCDNIEQFVHPLIMHLGARSVHADERVFSVAAVTDAWYEKWRNKSVHYIRHHPTAPGWINTNSLTQAIAALRDHAYMTTDYDKAHTYNWLCAAIGGSIITYNLDDAHTLCIKMEEAL